MQTITTKYHGPTNTKGARISATTTGGKRIYIPFDYEHDDTHNHAAAAQALRDEQNWAGEMVGGHTKTGMVWVFTYHSPRVLSR